MNTPEPPQYKTPGTPRLGLGIGQKVGGAEVRRAIAAAGTRAFSVFPQGQSAPWAASRDLLACRKGYTTTDNDSEQPNLKASSLAVLCRQYSSSGVALDQSFSFDERSSVSMNTPLGPWRARPVKREIQREETTRNKARGHGDAIEMP